MHSPQQIDLREPLLDNTATTMDEETLTDAVQRLKHLKTLYSSDLITQEDFETRRSQIVDELTGTSSIYQSSQINPNYASTRDSSGSTILQLQNSLKNNNKNNNGKGQRRTGNPPIKTPINILPNNSNKSPSKLIKIKVVKHGPPDWTKIRVEKAEKWIYDYESEKWLTEQCKVKIDEVPFDKGGLRYVFHLQDITGDLTVKWVAKMSQELRDSVQRDIYFNDVRMQAIARYFCHGKSGYNSYNPPKKVDFLDAFVLHLKQREGSPVCHVERYIEGEYIKYNNNVGWVSDHSRNTPQTFAHFTYEASRHKLLVCDIQGVNDVYTDPQVHSAQNQKAFGRGNLGLRGFQNFLRTHRCNVLCEYFALPNINQLPIQHNMGTVPAQTKIAQGSISTVRFDFDKAGKIALLCDKGFPQRVDEESEIDDFKLNGNGNNNNSKNNNDSGSGQTNDSSEKQGCCCVIL